MINSLLPFKKQKINSFGKKLLKINEKKSKF